ncbi:5-formyltetrahydrofolate cyclo-ligase [Trinickia terrae]|uniref:5-formyltetrahydrofolate cyclo-ligase n=1 Tax=Trinickia terrae TaxID=2571161 RepID=A0A4U1HBN2_9BURK|nr:5-formyltetrahydrofolate cyclo-ligase [Trinickia terrae]TKC78211.1 5-formyltetrahydrofolate cyclo-ligase [Trinickia terrae]
MSESIARNPAAKRKSELRKMLLEARKTACCAPDAAAALGARILDILEHYAPRVAAFYWPLTGEFDARDALAEWLSLDARRQAALPVIPVIGTALEFHEWAPGMPMKIGHHRIPEPESARVLVPDLLLIPCVGFDGDGYRLGYGGGYYDRTLAAWPGAVRPATVGVAFEACRINDLPREAHDVPLDAIVTDAGSYMH